MKRIKIELIFTYILTLFILSSCQNRNKELILNMVEYWTPDSVLSCKIPPGLRLEQSRYQFLLFQGNKKFVNIRIIPSANSRTKDATMADLVGNHASEMTLIVDNDSMSAYEIQRGLIRIPAQVVSVNHKNGVDYILTTMGYDIDVHKAINQSIHCHKLGRFHGEYMDLSYPSSWTVDTNPGTLSADVYISQSDHAFGVWLFRFEKEDSLSFKEAMNNFADYYRKLADVKDSYVKINNREWCKHDITMMIGEMLCRQISYYCIEKDFIYNVKFGNDADEVEKNLANIDSIMNTVAIVCTESNN